MGNPNISPFDVDPFSIRLWLESGLTDATPEIKAQALRRLQLTMSLDQFELLKAENYDGQ